MVYWKTVARSRVNHRPRLMTLTLPHITKTLSHVFCGFCQTTVVTDSFSNYFCINQSMVIYDMLS